MGDGGDPTAPGSRKGGAVKRNLDLPRAANQSLSAVK